MPQDLPREGRNPEPEENEKQRLRRELSLRCEALPAEAARRASEAMVQKALEMPEIRSARALLVCLSFGWEIDTWSLVDQLLASGKEVFVPRTLRRRRQLALHAYPCPLVATGYGLQQPSRRAPELPGERIDATIEAALLPGAGFDTRGARLGHGAGYFDRFLAGRPFPAIGVAFDFQVVERLPREPHDVPMAAVVSDLRIYRPA